MGLEGGRGSMETFNEYFLFIFLRASVTVVGKPKMRQLSWRRSASRS